jgi:hypothetical protein
MTVGSASTYRAIVRCASSETTMCASIFASPARRNVAPVVANAQERSWAVWKVATTGTRAAHSASTDTLGVAGSWMCTRSKRPSASQRRTRPATRGPNETRATEPL